MVYQNDFRSRDCVKSRGDFSSCVRLSVGVIGISYKTADLSLREALSRAAEVFRGEKAIFFPHPTILLSTCNRTEIYFAATDLAKAHTDILAVLRGYLSFAFEHTLYSYFGCDCFFHLAAVTSGLDSAIYAETEIQRQVKKAYAASQYLTTPLHYLFQKALKIGKNIRTKMELLSTPTLYSTLWEMAPWTEKPILLIGFSEINRGFIAYLLHKNVQNITLCTRAKPNIEKVRVVSREELKYWQKYPLIVSASKSKEYLIQGKGDQSHCIFDLSVPRNVDPTMNARIYNIEEINQKMVLQKNETHLERSFAFIEQNVRRLMEVYALKKVRGRDISEMESHL